jgi:hypothetical protein
MSRRTDFYLPGRLPLELSLVFRTQDSRSRAFGIGGNHSLNIWPVGNKWPFTWMDLILEDGGRYRYRRSDWGVSYWDAVYAVEPTITDFYSSYVTWNWPGWKLVRPRRPDLFLPRWWWRSTARAGGADRSASRTRSSGDR